jgi:hypothetical protein
VPPQLASDPLLKRARWGIHRKALSPRSIKPRYALVEDFGLGNEFAGFRFRQR